jgi:transketolase
MNIVVPADPQEAQCLAKISYETPGPMYIRLGKSGDPIIHETKLDFRLGKALMMAEGKSVAIFAIGSMVLVGKQAVEILGKKGLRPTLINMHTLKPLDKEIVIRIAKTHSIIFSIEEHHVEGGLGTAIAEILLEIGYSGFFKKYGIPDKLSETIGCAEYLRQYYGLSADRFAENVWEIARKSF